ALVLLPALAQMRNGNESVSGHTQNADSDSNARLTALGWTLLKMTGFVAVMLVVGRRVIPWSLENVAATGSRALFTLAVLGIALGVALGSAKL
ncbi:cation:proton antiport protein, partial [Xylella fastidiosa subsp. multiplex]